MAEDNHFHPDTYMDMVAAQVPGYERLQSAVVAASAQGGFRAGSVLDLGTGTGVTALRVLAQHPGARLSGLDENEAMLERARRSLPDAVLHVGRLQGPLPDGPFDLVTSALAVHHLDGPGKADLFRRVAVVLRPGGRFVLGDLVVPAGPAEVVTPVEGGHDQPSTVDDQLRWLAEAGFQARCTWAEDDLAVVVGDLPA